MIRRRRGRIVSIAGLAVFGGASALGVGKTALTCLTESLAKELEYTGVSVFSVHPGLVRTHMTRSFDWTDAALVGRNVPPERAAALVVRIAHGEVDALTGRHISVTDDLTELVSGARQIEERRLHALRMERLDPS